ncbi:putative cation-dependent mannose-6-phosphate receptor-like [Apostichopus japonicus]|uniref:Putative cation-dependent mannose-6-phosphate receptor-like n=1 Tax=Stichopus japonicus TaxID=307972 RepID=A0A2G8JZ74_STIJA|nr:putative cation-dependent mannose-6-phosphate receptor-like [Apostichopus japonicus]
MTVFTGFSSSRAASGDCVKVSNCKCQYQDDQSVIDLGSIGKRNDFAFPYQKSQDTLSSYEYAYNPCYPVTDTDQCKDVAACQKDTNDHFQIGDASSADFQRAGGFSDDITLRYTSIDHLGNNKLVIVKLICDQTAKTPQLEIISESPTSTYNMELTSECCCPDGCADRPPPRTPEHRGD